MECERGWKSKGGDQEFWARVVGCGTGTYIVETQVLSLDFWSSLDGKNHGVSAYIIGPASEGTSLSSSLDRPSKCPSKRKPAWSTIDEI